MKKLVVGIVCLILLAGCGGNTGGVDSGNGDSGNGDSGGNNGGTDDGGTISGSSIQFDISDAVAILKTDASAAQVVKASATGSNILKLTASGTLEDVFQSAEPITASTLYIAPDGKLYIVFQSPVTVNDEPCILLRLGRDGTGGCVDSTLMGIDIFSTPTKPIQFDSEGNIYYAGYTSEGQRVLRKQTPDLSEMVDLVNDNISIERFLVGNDGVVYLSGTTEATQTTFFRRILTSGSLENLLNGAQVQSLYPLPDNNIYAGGYHEIWGIQRVRDEGIDQKYFIGESDWDSPGIEADFEPSDNIYDTCTVANRAKYEGFCGYAGAIISSFYRSPTDHVYVVAGSGDSASLWQYWPDVMPIDKGVYRPTIVSGTMTTLLIAGYDGAQTNKLIAYNTADQSEIDLLNGVNVEVYHFSYSASTGRIIFDGLRFSDNKYIIGSIDTQNGNALTVLESGIRYEDMQFFE